MGSRTDIYVEFIASMSNPPGAPSRSSSIANGPPSAGIAPSASNPAPPTPSTPSQQNLNQIVRGILASNMLESFVSLKIAVICVVWSVFEEVAGIRCGY